MNTKLNCFALITQRNLNFKEKKKVKDLGFLLSNDK